jgi:hypothetical protein
MLELAVLEFFRMFVLLVEKKPVENASGECTNKRPKWSYPGLVDGWLVGDDRLRGAPPLIRGGGEIAERGVSPVHVVEPFDVIE